MKPRVAIFDFGCCEGCQLQIVNLEEQILDLLGAVDVVMWREAMAEKAEEYDIAIIEGSITQEHEMERLRGIREKAKLLIAIGACAVTGGVNAIKNRFNLQEVSQYVYGENYELFPTIETRPLSAVVKVDAVVPGCPINRGEFVEVVKALLLGKKPVLPNNAVCVECKQKDNVCVFNEGQFCLGPVTRGGCTAICPSFGEGCTGCRGLVPEPNLHSHNQVLAEHGLQPDQIIRLFNIFGAAVSEVGCLESAITESTGGQR
jgi:sulfhydrogenase subunit delta